MNKRYISPEVAVYDITAVTLLSTSTRNITIIDSDSGGDDGSGGYNPESFLSRQTTQTKHSEMTLGENGKEISHTSNTVWEI